MSYFNGRRISDELGTYRKKKREDMFTLEAGRIILRNGKPFIGISREGDTFPTEADEATKVIVRLLNKLK